MLVLVLRREEWILPLQDLILVLLAVEHPLLLLDASFFDNAMVFCDQRLLRDSDLKHLPFQRHRVQPEHNSERALLIVCFNCLLRK